MDLFSGKKEFFHYFSLRIYCFNKNRRRQVEKISLYKKEKNYYFPIFILGKYKIKIIKDHFLKDH